MSITVAESTDNTTGFVSPYLQRIVSVIEKFSSLELDGKCLGPIQKPPGTVPILRSPRSKMGLSPSPRRFLDWLSVGDGPHEFFGRRSGNRQIRPPLLARERLAAVRAVLPI